MVRTPFVCGNWKMHTSIDEALALVDALIPKVAALSGVEVGIAPPFTALHAVRQRLAGSSILLSAQNCHEAPKGAFTGEVSVSMLKDVGCDYVLIGHSERRQYFSETDEGVARKVRAALDGELKVIVALGETLEEREGGRTLDIVKRQLEIGLKKVRPDEWSRVVLAYEPVWAIGTGRTATPEQAQEVHAALRSEVGAQHGSGVADALRIQYGGSMKPANAAELLKQGDIDGGLIGGASLKAEDFLAICGSAAG